LGNKWTIGKFEPKGWKRKAERLSGKSGVESKVDSMDLDEGLKRDREGRKDGQERSRIV
jgi:hypothetical protein